MYTIPHLFGGQDHLKEVSQEAAEACKQECQQRGPYLCDEIVFRLCCFIMAENYLHPPSTADEAIELYLFLRTCILKNINCPKCSGTLRQGYIIVTKAWLVFNIIFICEENIKKLITTMIFVFMSWSVQRKKKRMWVSQNILPILYICSLKPIKIGPGLWGQQVSPT